ncbi:MAG: YjjG family noncanonical pyrimidine nucleotidase [Bacteroidales bacterium]|nr:YjjG family noncanonical pyrimidine nucleotidase [Candidatus Colicola coprequi]
MKNYKAVLIDWDQTIGDWDYAAYHALQDLFAQYRLEEFFPSFQQWFDTYEEHNLVLWGRYGKGEITRAFLQRDRFLYPITQQLRLDIAPRPLIDLADRIGKDFLQLTNRYFTLLPDAAEIVRYLADKYPLTIISNGFGEVQHYKIAHSGLQQCFKYILLSEEVGINKPQPGIYQRALELNGVTADEAIMIGDSYNSDILGAQNAHIDQLWIRPSSAPKEQTATYEVTNIRDIMQIL